MRPWSCAIGVVALLAGLVGGDATAGGRTLRVYNWSEYIAPGLVEAFTAETGIAVVYETYASSDPVETMLMAGGSGYDLVVVSSEYLGRLIERRAIAPLDASRLSRSPTLDPEIMAALARIDPGNRHAIPYLWGQTGLGLNRSAIARHMPDAPVDSWAMLFDPAIVSRLAECGIALVDAPEEALAAAMLYLGRPPDLSDAAARAEAMAVLAAVSSHVRSVRSTMSGGLAYGDYCVVLGWSSDVVSARETMSTVGLLDFIIPREGGLRWIDVFVMPADATHRAEAKRFIEFMLRPAVIAMTSSAVWTANAVPDAAVFTDPAVLADRAVVPDAATRARLHDLKGLDAASKSLLDSAWTRFKVGAP